MLFRSIYKIDISNPNNILKEDCYTVYTAEADGNRTTGSILVEGDLVYSGGYGGAAVDEVFYSNKLMAVDMSTLSKSPAFSEPNNTINWSYVVSMVKVGDYVYSVMEVNGLRVTKSPVRNVTLQKYEKKSVPFTINRRYSPLGGTFEGADGIDGLNPMNSMAFYENFMYAAVGSYGLAVYDISTPGAPKLTMPTSIPPEYKGETSADYRRSVIVDDDSLFVSFGSGDSAEVREYSLANAAEPVYVAKYMGAGGSLAVYDNTLYVGESERGIYECALSGTGGALTLRSEIETKFSSVQIEDGTLYAGGKRDNSAGTNTTIGIVSVDISSVAPVTPETVVSGNIAGFAVKEGYAYYFQGWSFYAVNLNNSQEKVIFGNNGISDGRYEHYHHIITEGDFIYALKDGGGGPLLSFEIKNSLAPELVYTSPVGQLFNAHEAVLYNGHFYTVCDWNRHFGVLELGITEEAVESDAVESLPIKLRGSATGPLEITINGGEPLTAVVRNGAAWSCELTASDLNPGQNIVKASVDKTPGYEIYEEIEISLPPVISTQPVLSKKNYATAWNDGNLEAVTYFTNISDVQKTPVIVLASYEIVNGNEILRRASIGSVTLAVGEKGMAMSRLNIPSAERDDFKIKVLTWDGVDGLFPLCDAIILPD